MSEKVLIAGGSGLVGSRLSHLLLEQGYDVSILSRSQKKIDGLTFIHWDPSKELLDNAALDADHLINLAGAGIADRPWTTSRKKELRNSRLISTRFLLDQFESNNIKLKSYLGASAIGYYGDGGGSIQEEGDTPGFQSFMTTLCKDWESAHQEFEEIADQTSILRIGIVLTSQGGAYPKMRMSFKFGIGTYFGSGDQYYSWIHIDDLANMIIHLLDKNTAAGIYNAVSPNPKTNIELTQTIKKALGISGLILPAPSFILKTVMGQMSRVILNSNRVSSKKIEKTGFSFDYQELEDAIKDLEARAI